MNEVQIENYINFLKENNKTNYIIIKNGLEKFGLSLKIKDQMVTKLLTSITIISRQTPLPIHLKKQIKEKANTSLTTRKPRKNKNIKAQNRNNSAGQINYTTYSTTKLPEIKFLN